MYFNNSSTSLSAKRVKLGFEHESRRRTGVGVLKARHLESRESCRGRSRFGSSVSRVAPTSHKCSPGWAPKPVRPRANHGSYGNVLAGLFRNTAAAREKSAPSLLSVQKLMTVERYDLRCVASRRAVGARVPVASPIRSGINDSVVGRRSGGRPEAPLLTMTRGNPTFPRVSGFTRAEVAPRLIWFIVPIDWEYCPVAARLSDKFTAFGPTAHSEQTH